MGRSRALHMRQMPPSVPVAVTKWRLLIHSSCQCFKWSMDIRELETNCLTHVYILLLLLFHPHSSTSLFSVHWACWTGATLGCLFPILPHTLYPQTKGLHLKTSSSRMGEATQSDSVGGHKGLKLTSLPDCEWCWIHHYVQAVMVLPLLLSSQDGRRSSHGVCSISTAGDLARHPTCHRVGV